MSTTDPIRTSTVMYKVFMAECAASGKSHIVCQVIFTSNILTLILLLAVIGIVVFYGHKRQKTKYTSRMKKLYIK